jgi:hypothetical protein
MSSIKKKKPLPTYPAISILTNSQAKVKLHKFPSFKEPLALGFPITALKLIIQMNLRKRKPWL